MTRVNQQESRIRMTGIHKYITLHFILSVIGFNNSVAKCTKTFILKEKPVNFASEIYKHILQCALDIYNWLEGNFILNFYSR